MAAPAKLLHVMGLLGKIESTYGTAATPSTTSDGIQMQYKDRNVGAIATIDYSFDGDLGPSVGALGQVIQAAPSGRSVKADIPLRARGAGTAYSASILPNIHTILKACGFDAAVTTTVSSEKWTYTPTGAGAGYSSMTNSLYCRGELWTAVGMLGSLKFDAPDVSPPLWTAGLMGILNALPSDASVPAITYPNQSVQPPLASSVTFAFGTFTSNAVVRSSSFDLQRELSPRVAQSGSGGHLGFVPGDRKPIMKFTLEATALAASPYTSANGFDPYSLRDLGTSLACSLQYGSAQYNRFKVAFPQCQVIAVDPSNDGPTATVDITVKAYNSTAASNDDVSITFD